MSPIERVEASRRTLSHAQRLVREARINLYEAIAVASEEGHGTRELAEAAGWKTKKAVYDAIQAVRDV